MAEVCRVLFIDDEAKSVMRWFVERLRLLGLEVVVAESFSGAVALLRQEQGRASSKLSIDAVILDCMFPLTQSDVPAFRELVNREPRLPNDAIGAGAALLALVKSVLPDTPIFILTNLTRDSEYGRKVLAVVEPLVQYVQVKPASEEFLGKLKEALPRCFPEVR